MAGKDEKPVCKYGEKCYRKNQEHLNQFSHPAPEKPVKVFSIFEKKPAAKKEDSSSKNAEKTDDGSISTFSSQEPAAKRRKTECSPTHDDNLASSEKPDVNIAKSDDSQDFVFIGKLSSLAEMKQCIKDHFLFEMPEDFYAVWNLAKKLTSAGPEKAFSCCDVTLCGPFDVLAGKFENVKSLREDDFLIHDRYPLDPPELQTVAKASDIHVGYLRDDPKAFPAVLYTNTNETCGWTKLIPVGDNLFAALHSLIKSSISSSKSEAKSSLLAAVEKEAKNLKYSLEPFSQKVKERKKKIVAPTIHGAGIVVPVHDDVGYRELPENNGMLKKMISTIGHCKDTDLQVAKMEKIQEIITYVQFANDECDYGMGLELGIDLFCSGFEYFHPQVRQLLKVAYDLLNREEFWRILAAHLKNRNRKQVSVV